MTSSHTGNSGLEARGKRLVREAIEKLEIDLNGITVLTEAASGNYVYTPLLCAAAGGIVTAVAKDSRYGPAEEVITNTERLAREMGLAGSIDIKTAISDDMWAGADIVTNLGFVRPIGKDVVTKLKATAAVPIMFETWEFRESDLDLGACWERGICVLGTNEEHGAIKILDYLGMLVANKLHEQGVEVLRSKIIVLGHGKFFLKVSEALQGMGAFVLRWMADVDDVGDEVISGERLEALRGADALIVADGPTSQRILIGTGGFIPVAELRRNCPDAIVVQLGGALSRIELDSAGMKCIPAAAPPPGHMGWSLSELGPKPVIDLHAAGLKVGELLARGRLEGLSPEEATANALLNPVCQDFSPEQKRLYRCPF